MRRDHEKFESAGARIVCIGIGGTEERAAFLERHGPYPFPILADPTRASYVAFGLVRGTLAQVVFNPVVLRAGMAAFQDGHRLEPIAGDPYQLGGSFVVDAAGIVRFAHPGKLSSDFPANDAVLAAIGSLAG